MAKRFYAGCAAACALILSSALAYAADVPYDISSDTENKNIVVSGTLQDGANEEVTLVIMKLNKELSVLESGMSAKDDIFYIRQVKTDSDGKYNFIIDYTTSDAGQHKARLVTKKGADICDLYVPIVDPDAYKTAAAAVNTAASSASLTDTEFVNVINDNMDALVFDYELNSVVDFNAAMKNFRAHIKRNPLSEDDTKEVDNTKAFRTFVIAQGVESGKVTDLTPYISDMLIDTDVVADYKTRTKNNEEAARYITGKMKKLSLDTAAEINASAKTALLYGIIRYADGPGDVQTALENYGEVADVTGSINLTACAKMAGKDYDSTTAI
ncbi:MAG: hypothetical protein ACI4DY_04405, partial [Monoglobaceae bacterium]